MIQMTRDEWEEYCKAEAAGDLDAQREIIRRAEERFMTEIVTPPVEMEEEDERFDLQRRCD